MAANETVIFHFLFQTFMLKIRCHFNQAKYGKFQVYLNPAINDPGSGLRQTFEGMVSRTTRT